MSVTYIFPATTGIQAGKTFYTATIPYKCLVRLFRFDDEFVPAELRAQRNLNEGRVNAIADYITGNPDTYVLPGITASCDSSMTFTQLSPEHGLGLLQIPVEACLLINDGQHRRKGLEKALDENPALSNESVSVTLYYDQGLHASQQMFADINGNANKPSGSLSALYDLRNPFSRWVLNILDRRPTLKSRIDMENAAPGKKSVNLWSLVAMHTFINMLTSINAKNIKSVPDLDRKAEEVVAFLDKLEVIPLWKAMVSGEMSAESIRDNHVIGHAVFLHAVGLLGAHVKDLSQLDGLASIQTAKSSTAWNGRCVLQGKMRKTGDGVKSTASVLMNLCGIPLPADIAKLEALFEQGK